MYVVAKHRIKDADRFFAASHVAAENAPAGVYGRQFCPSRDRREAVCLWEADSVEDVERYLDSLIGDAGENAYFPVSTDDAIGIPAPIGATPRRGTSVSFERYHSNSAENYERYFVPTIGAPLAADLVALASLRAGERVADIACGTGIVARLAAERVGAAGAVAAVDANAGMLTVARRTAPAEAPIEWYEAPAEALPLPDESFDVVFCQLGLQFFADRSRAVREMRRVLVRRGRLLLNVPGPTPPIFGVLESALARRLGRDVAAFVGTVFSLHDPAEVGELLTRAGLSAVEARQTEKELVLPSAEDFLWQYVHSTPLAVPAAELDEEGRAAVERAFVSGCGAFVEGGRLVLRQPITVATAVK